MMVGEQLLWAAACAMAGFDMTQASPLDQPRPEIFVHAEDQERARLLSKPCTEADVGRGCYLFDGRALREAPCTYHIDAETIGSLPTDQCYKMEEPRRFRGIWINEFEGQAFIPEGTTRPEWPNSDPKSPEWREQFNRAHAATIWLSVERARLGRDFRNSGRKMFIDFIGRKTACPGWYGHLGMSGSEIIVDRLISLKKIE